MVSADDGSAADASSDDSLRSGVGRRLTRRRLLLAGGVALGAWGVGRMRTAAPTATATPDGTWPVAGRDATRTSAARGATPPSAPSVAWRQRPVPAVDSLVVGPEQVYVGSQRRDNRAPQVAALARDDGTVQWTEQAPGTRLAYADGAVYATGTAADERDTDDREPPYGSVARLDATTGETRWRRPVRDRGERLLLSRRTVYVGSHSGLEAVSRDSGRRVFRGQTWGAPTTPLLVDGSLVLTGGRVGKYGARRWSEVVRKRLPTPVWTRNPVGYTLDPVVVTDATSGSELIATGTLGMYNDDVQTVRAHALSDGTRRWNAVDAASRADPTVVKELCAAENRLFHALRTGTDAQRRRALVCREATTGTLQWRASFSNWLRAVVVAGDLVLAGTRWDGVSPAGPGEVEAGASTDDTPPPGRVTAFTLDGEGRWRVPISGSVAHVVPVANRVFVGTDDASYGGRTARPGQVIALE